MLVTQLDSDDSRWLGDQHVTSIEYEAGVAQQARQALTATGYRRTALVELTGLEPVTPALP
ncbi:MAG: hypothetical protein ACRDQH_14380, partial [Pseudonocardiaceae bacterium]